VAGVYGGLGLSNESHKFGLIDAKWQHWGASILLTIVLPLLPLILEKVISGRLGTSSLLIASTVYCCSLALASQSVLVITLGVVMSVVLSVFYGVSSAQVPVVLAGGDVVAWVCIIGFAVTHGIERYDQHVTRGRNFLDFRRNGE
jgi:hypothetical protein